VDIKVLGVLTVTEGATAIAPAIPQARQVLALLAAMAGRVVPTAFLIEEIWPGEPPHHARAMLQSYVTQLRELVAAALRNRAQTAPGRGRVDRQAADILADTPGGYRLDSGGASSDAWDFERMVGAGYRAMSVAELDVAAARLREALLLWRGEPFADVERGVHLAELCTRLCRSRERALGLWAEAELRLGRYRQAAADVEVLGAGCRLGDELPDVLRSCADEGAALAAYQQLVRGWASAASGEAPGRVPEQRGRLYGRLTYPPRLPVGEWGSQGGVGRPAS
jgi:DNA-binding SARP family transcriptional activator